MKRVSAKKSTLSQDQAAGNSGVVGHVFKLDSRNYSEVMESVKCKEWHVAVREEISALEANDAWTLARRSRHINFLRTK
uniref:Uncharacterized protein n=1 Tax=Peronospora matthiolae TaxID=2874970 RepID=A0AAV1TBR9_9STRA